MKTNLIILHGWGLSGDRFSSLTSEFKRLGYNVFAPDFPGFGKSQLPSRPLSLDDYASFLHEFIKEKHIDDPVLIGHSFGGRVALWYQAIYPQALRALILSGTPGFTPVAKRKIQFFVLLAKIGKLFFTVPPLSFVQERVRRWFYYIAGARDFYRAEGVMRETFKIIVQQELETAMKKVHVPTFLVWGQNDSICPVSVAYRMRDVISGSTLQVVPNQTHALPFKEPKVFSSIVDAFLKNL